MVLYRSVPVKGFVLRRPARATLFPLCAHPGKVACNRQRGAPVMPKGMTPKLIEAHADQASIYARYALDGETHIVCPQRRAPVLLLENLDPRDRREIAAVRKRNPLAAIQELQRASGCDARQAKANILHLRDAGSRCHKCEAPVPRGALLCGRCLSVNLEW